MSADRSITTTVFNIQTYCIHDGPGIRVTVFVKGCPLRCTWCANPESNLMKPQLMFYKDKCTGCGRCVELCPQKAITIRETDGKYRAWTDRTLCVDCGACAKPCPAEAREIAGEIMDVATALKRVLDDKLFLDSSGGGMTISGGECLACPDFSENLLMAAHEEGLHTAVESSCFASESVIDRIYSHVDLALCDIKHMDPEKHKEYTGVSNEGILKNIIRINRTLKVPVWIRVPTIPGHNDSDENIEAMAKFVHENLTEDTRVCLLPYHRLGESKNESLGKDIDWSIDIPSDEHMEHLKSIVEKYGIPTQIGG
ncbi:MAG: glycyl-radical enzyme activating protein [Clostridiales bacterium]|nr:glycyl-radical enzyme activating protein [Clostridiales bacterium]MCD8224149.1 glycyl-radical enzyme activating protein [Clostridiales bacterium]